MSEAAKSFDPWSLANTALNGMFNIWSVSKANKTNQAIANQTNQMTWDINAMNNQWNKDVALEMFDLENAYNSPQQVRARLEQAGINPRVAMANGQASQFASGDIATPTAQAPSPFQMAQVSPIPSPFGNVFGELLQAAKIKTELATAKNLGAQTSRIDRLLDEEEENLQLKNDFQEITNDITQTHGHNKAKAEILEMLGNLFESLSSAQLNQASTELRRIEKKIKDEEFNWLPQTLQQRLRNLVQEGYTMKAQEGAYQAGASASIASANLMNQEAKESEARTELTQEQQYQLMAMRDDNIKLQHNLAEAKRIDVDLATKSLQYQIDFLKNQKLISDQELKEAEYNTEMARKTNNVWYLREAVNQLSVINDGVTKWLPYRPQITTNTQTFTGSDSRGNTYGNTTTSTTRKSYGRGK